MKMFEHLGMIKEQQRGQGVVRKEWREVGDVGREVPGLAALARIDEFILRAVEGCKPGGT